MPVNLKVFVSWILIKPTDLLLILLLLCYCCLPLLLSHLTDSLFYGRFVYQVSRRLRRREMRWEKLLKALHTESNQNREVEVEAEEYQERQNLKEPMRAILIQFHRDHHHHYNNVSSSLIIPQGGRRKSSVHPFNLTNPFTKRNSQTSSFPP